MERKTEIVGSARQVGALSRVRKTAWDWIKYHYAQLVDKFVLNLENQSQRGWEFITHCWKEHYKSMCALIYTNFWVVNGE